MDEQTARILELVLSKVGFSGQHRVQVMPPRTSNHQTYRDVVVDELPPLVCTGAVAARLLIWMIEEGGKAYIATTDISTVVMLLDQLESQEGLHLQSVLMPTWGKEGGRPVFENRYATNAYLLLEVDDRETAMKWWEEWADYVRTDLKTPFPDEEYAWIEPRLKAQL